MIFHNLQTRPRRAGLVAVLLTAPLVAGPAAAQSDWDYSATLYGWFTGVTAELETPFGDLEAEQDFSDILENLDLAFFGAFEARNGRWAVITDIAFADLSVEVDSPFGRAFRSADLGAEAVLVSTYATYAVVDEPTLRFDLGGGVRYTKVSLESDFNSAGTVPDASFDIDGDWTDLLLAARVRSEFNDDWFGTAYADIGGFGIEDSSELTWQVFAGVGYRINDSWSAIGGYRHLQIEREIGGADVTLELYGPVLGVQTTF